MIVLHVFYNFLPDLTGSSIRSAGVVSGQRSRGMGLVLVSSPFQPGFSDAQEESYAGVKLFRAYQVGNPTILEGRQSLRVRIRKLTKFPGFIRTIEGIVRSERVTHIHAHSTFYCALAAWIAARRTGCKVVYEFRSLWEERSKRSSFLASTQASVLRWLETLSLRLVDRVVTINHGLKQEILARGIPADKVVIVPNAVEDDLIEEGKNLGVPEAVMRFGYVGNFSDIEGLDLLVKAFGQAFPVDRRHDVELVFRGKGPYAGTLASTIEAVGDPRIRLGGPFSRDELVDVYRDVDCIVLPRRRNKINETVTPLKPLEAMAYGRVVGVSDVGGLLEVVGGTENAWVFDADSIESLASSLRNAFEARDAMAALASRGRDFVQKHRRWNSVAERYWTVYDQA